MPTMPLAVASMLACARIGAVHWYTVWFMLMTFFFISNLSTHSVVFSDFNEDVLRQRIKEGVCLIMYSYLRFLSN